MTTTLLHSWREQRGYWAALSVLYTTLQLHSIAEVADAMTEADLRRLGRHLVAAVAAGKSSPDVLVAGIGVLAVAAAQLPSLSETREIWETLLSAPAVVQSAAAWALGYLQERGAEGLLRQALATGGGVEEAGQEALRRMGI